MVETSASAKSPKAKTTKRGGKIPNLRMYDKFFWITVTNSKYNNRVIQSMIKHVDELTGEITYTP